LQASATFFPWFGELGAGFAIAIWFLVLMFRHAWANLDNWTENAGGGLTVAALVGCVGILIHSFLDFNLQIPANAAMFYVLCAIAASNPLQESRRRRSRRSHHLVLDPRPKPLPPDAPTSATT
jgi:hypothetical protein